MILTILIVVSTLSFLLHFGTRRQPLHPDSGFYLYIPFFKSIGFTFLPLKNTSFSPLKHTGDYNILDAKFLLRIFSNIVFAFGGSTKSFRIFYAFYNFLTGLAIYTLASHLCSPLLGLVAATLYLIMSLSPFLDSFQLHAEQYALLPMITALIAIILTGRGDILQIPMIGNYVLFVIGGLLLGIVIICLKISYVAETSFILCLSLFFGSTWGFFLTACGLVSFVLFTILFIYIKTKSLSLFISSYSPKKLLHYKNTMLSDFNIDGGITKYNFKTYFVIFSCFFFGSYYFVVGIIHSVINYNVNIIAISLLPFVSLINIWCQRKFYMAHFYSVLPFASIVAAYGIEQMFGLTGISFVLNICFSIILLIPALVQIFQYYAKSDALTFHIKRSQVIRHKKTLNFVAEEGIAEYVKHNTAKDDIVLQWGYNHEFYVLAKRRAALSGHLAVTLMTDPLLNDASIPNWRKNVLVDIENLIPKFIVDFDGSLRIETVNKVSGHYYELDRNFYEIYPVYKLVNTNCFAKKTLTTDNLKSLTGNDTERNINNRVFKSNTDYIQFVNGLVMKGCLKDANMYTSGGIAKMFNDWQQINNEKKSVSKLLA